MKTPANSEIAMSAGPFLRLLMMIRERKVEAPFDARHGSSHKHVRADDSEPTETDTQESQLQPDRTALGPFLTMILRFSDRPVMSPRQPTASAENDAQRPHGSEGEKPRGSLCCRVVDALEAAASTPPLGRVSTHCGSGIRALAAVAQYKMSG